MTAGERNLFARAVLVALAGWALAESAMFARAVSYDHDAWVMIGTAAVMLVAALVSSVVGFAFCAIAGSALAWLGTDPVHAVQAMVVCSIANQLYAVWTIRASIRWNQLWPMLGAGAATIPLGVWLLLHVNAAYYAAGLGVFLVAYACHTMLRKATHVVRGGAWRDALAGALGGITGGLAGLPGSVVTIWCGMRGWDKLKQRAMYQPYILAMQVVTMICLRIQSPIRLNLVHDLRFVPFAVLGAMGGLALFRRMSNDQFQWTVTLLLGVSGVGLLARML